MHKIIYLFLLLPFLPLWAQKDAAAEPYLDKVSKDLAPGHALSIKFEYIRDDQQAGASIRGEGSLVLMDEKYKLEIDEAIIFFDGKTQYSLNLDIEEVYITVPDPEDKEFMFSDPIRLLRNYKEDFKYRLMGPVNFQGKSFEEVQLYPEELGGPYALIKLFFSAHLADLYGIVIRHKEGIVYTMLIENMEKVDDPGVDFFRFKQEDYPNVDVIDLLN